jgi:hypothetical protein
MVGVFEVDLLRRWLWLLLLPRRRWPSSARRSLTALVSASVAVGAVGATTAVTPGRLDPATGATFADDVERPPPPGACRAAP